jgi:hypothetical protein
MTIVDLFHALVWCHIATGAVGLGSFWVPVASRKGAVLHRRIGRLFAWLMIATGSFATGMGLCTLIAPIATHDHVMDPALMDPAILRGLFGHMMIYLAILTVSLAWHSLEVVRWKRDHPGGRNMLAVGMQLLVIAAAINCFVQGLLINQPLMLGIPVIGVASGITNLVFLFRGNPGRVDYLMEHIKAGVGAGISVYTAFLAFGMVRLFPDHAFNPAVWSIPTLAGVALILWHWRKTMNAASARNAGVGARIAH